MKRVTFAIGKAGWVFEAFLDWTCLLIGVNWTPPNRHILGYYLHIGPLIVGAYNNPRWR